MSIGGSNKLIGLTELAEYLGISRRTAMTRWREWGIKGHKVGREIRFAERDVTSWLATRETSGKL